MAKPVDNYKRACQVKIGLNRRSKINISLGELIDAVIAYLNRQHGISIRHYDFDGDRDISATIVKLSGISSKEGPWPSDLFLSFWIDRIAAKSERAKLGGDQRFIKIVKEKSLPSPPGVEALQTLPQGKTFKNLLDAHIQQCKIIQQENMLFADLLAEPNDDRSITFFPIDRWEGNTAIYTRTNT